MHVKGDPLNESIADVFAMLTVGDYAEPRYNYSWNRIGNVAVDNQFFTAGPLRSMNFADCDDDLYWYGVPFEQAFWQALHNFDCLDSTCTSSSEWGSDIGFSGREDARDHLGEALAYALDVTGASTTYDSIALNMYVKLWHAKSSSVALAFRDLFQNHGM